MADVSNIMGVSGSIVTQSISTMANMSDHTWVVKTTIKGSVLKGKPSVNLANGVWFSLGLTLSKMMESMIARVDCSVANGSISRYDTITIVDSCDDTTIGPSSGHLTNGVWITADGSSKGENQRKCLHFAI